MEGVSFAPVDDADELGLHALVSALEAEETCATPAAQPDAAATATDVAAADAASSPTATSTATTAADDAEAAAAPSATDAEAAAAAERAVLVAVTTGARLAAEQLPSAAAMSHVPSAARRLLCRRLCAAVAKARGGAFASAKARAEAALLLRGVVGGELCRYALAGAPCTVAGCPFSHERRVEHERAPATLAKPPPPPPPPPPKKRKPRDPTFGQISQYKKGGERPEAGVILVPVASAAAARVSLSGLTSTSPASASAAASISASAAASSATTAASATSFATASSAAASPAPDEPAMPSRPGFASSSALQLHPETQHMLAHALGTAPKPLHEWVAAEALRTQARSHPPRSPRSPLISTDLH